MTLAQKAEVLARARRRRAGRAALHAASWRPQSPGGLRAPGAARRAGRARRSWWATTSASGAAARATSPLLRRLGEPLGFEVVAVPPVLARRRRRSAARRIREALARGRRGRGARRSSAGRSSWTATSCAGRAAAARIGIPDREPRGRRTRRCPRAASTPPGAGCPAAAGARPRGGEPRAPADLRRGRASRWRPTCSTSTGDLYGRPLRLAFVARLREERAFRRPGRPRRADPARTSRAAPRRARWSIVERRVIVARRP